MTPGQWDRVLTTIYEREAMENGSGDEAVRIMSERMRRIAKWQKRSTKAT